MTQKQALSAILFLYREVLGRELPWLGGVERPRRPPRLTVAPTRTAVDRLLANLVGRPDGSRVSWAVLRVMECLRLRAKDVDLAYRQVLVRDDKRAKGRVTSMPEKLAAPLRAHLGRVRHASWAQSARGVR